MRRRVLPHFLLHVAPVAIVPLLGACSSATGSPSGGTDVFDAGPAAAPDTGPAPTPDAGGGITWTDLYRDFFGNAAPGPGCKGTGGQCHGGVDQGGGGVWVCGDTQESCWKGLTTATTALIDTKNPDNSVLLSVALRQRGGGNMPLAPTTYVFSDASIQRIRDWMAAGAQNN
jgi:hypothetical protein